MNKHPFISGIIATILLFVVFLILVTSISGLAAAKSQFAAYWYFLVPLAAGFGVQIGLYVHLRQIVQAASKKMVIMNGGTSTAAMVSCCAHYLANILPILGVSGVSAFVGRFQVQIFLVGLILNVVGIVILTRRIVVVRKHLDAPRFSTQPKPQLHRPLIGHWVVIGAFALVVLGVWVITGSKGTATRAADALKQRVPAARNETTLTKTNIEGGMTVAVTPKKNADGSWEFTVAIDNHSQNVMQDLVAVSSLTDAVGRQQPPKAWEGDPPGGHHRRGVLKFGPLSAAPARLTIRDLGGIPQRTFVWVDLQS